MLSVVLPVELFSAAVREGESVTSINEGGPVITGPEPLPPDAPDVPLPPVAPPEVPPDVPLPLASEGDGKFTTWAKLPMMGAGAELGPVESLPFAPPAVVPPEAEPFVPPAVLPEPAVPPVVPDPDESVEDAPPLPALPAPEAAVLIFEFEFTVPFPAKPGSLLKRLEHPESAMMSPTAA